MPDRASRETLARQWELLKLVPAHRPGATANELTERLQGSGFVTTKRTVERDLKELERVFPLQRNDKGRPYGWYWMRDADLGIPGVELAEALSLTLLEQFLRRMLPLTLWQAFEPRLTHAREKLKALTEDNKAAVWRDKVRYVSPTLPLEPPPIDETVLDALQRALLKNRQLHVAYRGVSDGDGEARELTLHPLALIQGGPVTYLAATASDDDDVRFYAVHRILAADIGIESATRPDGFSLDAYLARGAGHFANGAPDGKLQLEARIEPSLSRILAETPLSKDMEIRDDGEYVRITATVPDTWQLRWWILSQGVRIEVIGPGSLRSEIAHEISNMSALYAWSPDKHD